MVRHQAALVLGKLTRDKLEVNLPMFRKSSCLGNFYEKVCSARQTFSPDPSSCVAVPLCGAQFLRVGHHSSPLAALGAASR